MLEQILTLITGALAILGIWGLGLIGNMFRIMWMSKKAHKSIDKTSYYMLGGSATLVGVCYTLLYVYPGLIYTAPSTVFLSAAGMSVIFFNITELEIKYCKHRKNKNLN